MKVHNLRCESIIVSSKKECFSPHSQGQLEEAIRLLCWGVKITQFVKEWRGNHECFMNMSEVSTVKENCYLECSRDRKNWSIRMQTTGKRWDESASKQFINTVCCRRWWIYIYCKLWKLQWDQQGKHLSFVIWNNNIDRFSPRYRLFSLSRCLC